MEPCDNDKLDEEENLIFLWLVKSVTDNEKCERRCQLTKISHVV